MTKARVYPRWAQIQLFRQHVSKHPNHTGYALTVSQSLASSVPVSSQLLITPIEAAAINNVFIVQSALLTNYPFSNCIQCCICYSLSLYCTYKSTTAITESQWTQPSDPSPHNEPSHHFVCWMPWLCWLSGDMWPRDKQVMPMWKLNLLPHCHCLQQCNPVPRPLWSNQDTIHLLILDLPDNWAHELERTIDVHQLLASCLISQDPWLHHCIHPLCSWAKIFGVEGLWHLGSCAASKGIQCRLATLEHWVPYQFL